MWKRPVIVDSRKCCNSGRGSPAGWTGGCMRWQVTHPTPSRARAPYFASPAPGCSPGGATPCRRSSENRAGVPAWSASNCRLPIAPWQRRQVSARVEADLLGLFRVGTEVLADRPDLGLDLGEEDGIAAGQAHRRPAPFAIGRDVAARPRAIFGRLAAGGTNIEGPNGAISPEWQPMHWFDVTNSWPGLACWRPSRGWPGAAWRCPRGRRAPSCRRCRGTAGWTGRSGRATAFGRTHEACVPPSALGGRLGPPPRVVDPESDRLPREAGDVPQRREGRLVRRRAGRLAGRPRRGVAADAVVAEAGDGMRVRVAVVIDDALTLDGVAPEPAVVRAGRVLDHHGPRFERGPQLVLALALVPGRGGGVLLLDDHLAVGDGPGPAALEPADHAGRVVDAHGGVGAVGLALDEGAGVAHALVPPPAERDVTPRVEEGEQLRLVGGQGDPARERQVAPVGRGRGPARVAARRPPRAASGLARPG